MVSTIGYMKACKTNVYSFVLLILLLLALYPDSARAAQPIAVTLDGAPVQMDSPAVIKDGRTLVPMRAILEAFGADIRWDGPQQRVTAILDSTCVQLDINETTAYLSQKPVEEGKTIRWRLQPVELDAPARLSNGRTLVPLRFVSESLGANVRWDAAHQLVEISTPWNGTYDASLAAVVDIKSSAAIQRDDPEIIALARQITASSTSDQDKTRAVHDWITHNITYDTVSAHDEQNRAPQDALTVLQTKTGVCEGYANLAAALLRAENLPTRMIKGWARKTSETWPELLQRDETKNHAWNQVLANGRWIIMDVTWDAGSSDSGAFVQKYSTFYYDPDPTLFANDHRIEKPPLSPPDPANYYFRPTAAQRSEAAQSGIDYTKTMADFQALPFPKYYAWSEDNMVGVVDNGQRFINFQMETYHEESTRYYYILRLQQDTDNRWQVIESAPQTAEPMLPSGEYD